MPSLSFRDFDLNQTSITGRRNPIVTIDAFHFRYKMDKETHQRTDEIEGYTVDILARNRLQSVKIPFDSISNAVAQQIQDALRDHKIVKINFGATASTLRGRCYAMLNNGQLISGISCTATELNIVSIEDSVDELDDIDLDL